MVDFQQDGELLGRIRSIRKKFAQDMGFLPPVVHIRDNMDAARALSHSDERGGNWQR
jgi:flagellar biosynthesis protein FlhA